MKTTLALAAAAILLLVGSSKLNAQPTEHCYGFITSCGVVEYVICDYEMEDWEALEWADWYDFWHCELGGHL